ncbi:hypothetical protein KHQ81_01440 [Mycoplasmatota bacterium]|nr:hypothetical protein KHQ81_01440 [Mycoplasmatota bacterium]
MKRFSIVCISIITMILLVGCTEKKVTTKTTTTTTTTTNTPLDDVLSYEMKGSFDFFWNETMTTESLKSYGLTKDRTNGPVASIASSGFALSAIPIGIENGYITYDEGYERALKTLKSLKELEREHGFYYHFYTYLTGKKRDGVELSNIDTAIFISGALFAGEYFGGEVTTVAKEIYDEVNWQWFYNDSKNQFYMAWYPDKGFQGAWDFYAEQLMMYVLAAGSDTYPVGKEAYDGFIKHVATYKDHTFIHSWFGSLFTYQFSHAWIDFRNITDSKGINWFDNSVEASLANYEYTQSQSSRFETFNENVFGMTASDGPFGYSGYYGAMPSGYDNKAHKNDGTIPPCGALGSIVFTPELSINAANYFYNEIGEKIKGKYGFTDAYNLDEDWYASSHIGIDKGITLLMIENYRNETIWTHFMKNDQVQKGLETLGFTESGE